MKLMKLNIENKNIFCLVRGRDSIMLLAFFIFSFFFSSAQTLEEYQQQAGQNNPLLKSKFAAYQAALEKMPQAAGLPDPELSFNFFLMPMERYMGEQVGEASVMQMFPWFGSLQAGKEEANYMAQMKFAEFNDAKITLYHDVRLAWLAIYQSNEEIELLEQELVLMKSLEQLALARYSSGATGAVPQSPAVQPTMSQNQTSSGNTGGMAGMGNSGGPSNAAGGARNTPSMNSMPSMSSSSGGMVDVLLVQLQIKELQNKVYLQKQSQKPLIVNFNSLINRSKSEKVIVADTLLPIDLPASLSIIEDSILQNHPMLEMAQWDAKAREAQLRMAQLMGRPMIGVGLSYMMFRPREVGEMEMGPMENGRNMVMPMVKLTLPIYRGKYKAQQNEARLLKKSAEMEKESIENQLLSQLEQLLYNYEDATSKLDLLGDQIEITNQAIRLLTTSYSVGNAGIEDILKQRQNILNYKQQQIMSITEQHKAVSGINQIMGI